MTDKPALTRGLLAVLGFLAAIGPFATDMYLASFTDIAQDLGTQAPQVQLTLTAFFIGLGSGQLILGPASDRLGRRKLLLVGIGIFAASSVLMVFSPNIETLIGLRLIQGFSGAVGMVLSRAIAVDLSEGAQTVSALSLIAMVIGLGPLIAPVVGAYVATAFGWRGVLTVLASLAVLMFILSYFFVPESLPEHKRNKGGFWEIYGPIFKLTTVRAVVGYTLAFGFGFGAMMSYISASPFVGQTILGMSTSQYGLGFALSASAMILSNYINSRVSGKVQPRTMALTGLMFQLVAALSFCAMIFTDTLTIPMFIFSAFLLSGGAGLVMSNSNALGFHFAPAEAKGSASALMGTFQFTVAGAVSPVVGLWGKHTATPMGAVIMICVIGVATGLLLAGRGVKNPA